MAQQGFEEVGAQDSVLVRAAIGKDLPTSPFWEEKTGGGKGGGMSLAAGVLHGQAGWAKESL